jgi:nucleoside-diphosphate-sugar epimerase
MRILMTGSSGFVGINVSNYLNTFNYSIANYIRNSNFPSSIDAYLHFAGKAHDLKKIDSSLDYYIANTELTKKVFDAFLISDAKVFIALSSVKAVSDDFVGELIEECVPNPLTHYGKSKLLAENYIFSKSIPQGKRVYILRPCMIHGPGNKGNLNLLYNFISKGIPWPLSSFENKRSYLSIQNLCFVIKELLNREDIVSGIYNISDDVPLSTNSIIQLIALSQNKKPFFLNINKSIIVIAARIGDFFGASFNSERLHKLTQSYIVNNTKINKAIGKKLPVDSSEGLMRTFKSFSNNV